MDDDSGWDEEVLAEGRVAGVAAVDAENESSVWPSSESPLSSDDESQLQAIADEPPPPAKNSARKAAQRLFLTNEGSHFCQPVWKAQNRAIELPSTCLLPTNSASGAKRKVQSQNH